MRTKREIRASVRKLRREISAFSTTGQIDDVLAAVSRSDTPDTGMVTDILLERRSQLTHMR